MTDIIQVADTADMIINGYAFTKNMEQIRVLNLNNPEKAIILNSLKMLIQQQGYYF